MCCQQRSGKICGKFTYERGKESRFRFAAAPGNVIGLTIASILAAIDTIDDLKIHHLLKSG